MVIPPVTLSMISVISGFLLSIVSPASIKGLLGAQPTTNTMTKARVYVGLALVGDEGLGGDMPDLQTFDSHGEPLSKIGKSHKLPQGAFWDYYMDAKDGYNNNGPEYLSIRHYGDDPVCIAAIGVVGPDGLEYHIMGDIMHDTCGWEGYQSMRRLKLGDQEPTPYCFWLGGKPSFDFPNNVWLHLPDFIGTNQTTDMYNNNNRTICETEPRLHRQQGSYKDFSPLVFHPPLTYAYSNNGTFRGENATQHDPSMLFDWDNWRWRTGEGVLTHVSLKEKLFEQTRRRSGKKRNADARFQKALSRFSGQWAHSKSAHPGGSAVHACQSSHVVGPDLANSHERMYCKMATRQLLPFCSTADQVDCFDFDAGLERSALKSPYVALAEGQASSSSGSENPSTTIPQVSAARVRYDIGAMAFDLSTGLDLDEE